MNLLILSPCEHGVYGTCKKCSPKVYKALEKHMKSKLTKKQIKDFDNAIQKIREVTKD